jgi:hypothetical protein
MRALNRALSPMCRLLAVFAVFALAGTELSFAQQARIATRSDIVGAWELIPLSDALQPKVLQTNPWPAACQHFRYFEDGRLFTFMSNPRSLRQGYCHEAR